MRKLLRISALSLALTCHAYAGDIQFGVVEPPPPPPAEETTMNSMQTGGLQESSATEELQALVNLLGYLLPLI